MATTLGSSNTNKGSATNPNATGSSGQGANGQGSSGKGSATGANGQPAPKQPTFTKVPIFNPNIETFNQPPVRYGVEVITEKDNKCIGVDGVAFKCADTTCSDYNSPSNLKAGLSCLPKLGLTKVSGKNCRYGTDVRGNCLAYPSMNPIAIGAFILLVAAVVWVGVWAYKTFVK